MKVYFWIVVLVCVSACFAEPQNLGEKVKALEPLPCGSLVSMALPNGRVIAAELLSAGEFVPDQLPGGPPIAELQLRRYSALPSFCRVIGKLAPSSDSDINIEVWLPNEGWNEKFQAVGNGAFTGSIRYNSMATALARGYATSSTDTGHLGNTASFGLGHPEKVIDFGWRAVHEMTVAAKKVIAAHYGKTLKYSYWNGCSAGGRQAMKEAQRFPDDFDGIIAGAPGLDWTGRAGGALRVAKYLEVNPSARLSLEDRELLHSAVLEACDADDGVIDRVVGKPNLCKFDPSMLACAENDTNPCLSVVQINTVKMLYDSPVNPKTGRAITGLLPGSELGWTELGWTQSARATGLEHFRYLVFEEPDWVVSEFNFEEDIVRAEESDGDTLNALDPDLQPFVDRGGKLLQYHGWSDPQISPLNATQYYERVIEAMGGRATFHDHYRLFMVPGMGHCGGGEGPSRFDAVGVLEDWVEKGETPDRIVASRLRDGVIDRTRPLCPYPEVATYVGTGSTDQHENFVCES